MKRIRFTRLLALLTALAAVLTLAQSPGYASQFHDVEDSQVSLAVEVLSALGVVSGTETGRFSPEGHLTRAQLCKMAIEILGMGSQAQAQAYRTIFTDMGRNHWASGYVNLAAVTEIPAGSGSRLMLGLGNGQFGPDRAVTYQETVTLVLRILGYGEEGNQTWPYGAIWTATQLGLDKGLNLTSPSAPITRGQTALLFYRLLTTPPKGDSQLYAARLGTVVDDAILLANDASINGRSGWAIVATEGGIESYPIASAADESLLGRRGAVLLDKDGRFVTLLPDESSYVTAAVSSKQAYYLSLSGYGRYTLSENTTVYTGSTHDAGATTYKEYMASLRTGDVVTLYLDENGKVVGLYRAEASPETHFVVVNTNSASYETFRTLTGDERDYTIRKNGANAAMSDIHQYDVATYDSVSKVLDVCDVRLPCIYENASPSPTSPNQVTAAGGNQFEVMADAIWDFSDRKLGESITLLFTSNGKVAGLLPKGTGTATSLALGVLTNEGFELLGCNVTLKLPDDTTSGGSRGDILSAYSAEKGTLSLRLVGTHTNAIFSTTGMMLAGARVSSNVQVYEQTTSGLQARSLSDLPATVTVTQYHKDNSGLVDLIIVNPYSGGESSYGRIDILTGYVVRQLSAASKDEAGNETKAKWTLQMVRQVAFTGKDGTQTYEIGTADYANGYGTVTEYGGEISISYLQEVANVGSSAFYTQDGITYVRTSSGVYQVDENVLCFNAAAFSTSSSYPPTWVELALRNGRTWEGNWNGPVNEPWYPDAPSIVKFDSLGECRNFADTLTIYIDNAMQRVRIVVAS